MNADYLRSRFVTNTLTSISVAPLIASLIRSLVLVFFEVFFLAVVALMRTVTLAVVHTLLVSFVLRIVLALVLEKRGGHRFNHSPGETDPSRYRQQPGAYLRVMMFILSAVKVARPWPFMRWWRRSRAKQGRQALERSADAERPTGLPAAPWSAPPAGPASHRGRTLC